MNAPRRRRLVRAAAIAALLTLAACAPRTLLKPATEWPVRRAELQALENWSLSGRVAVAAADRGFSARLDWAQRPDSSRVDLAGPFGAGALRVEVRAGEVTVRDGEGAVVAAGTQALAERLGFDLPVNELRYWLLGVPAPGPAGAPAGEVLGPTGRPLEWADAGWWVRVEAWQPAGDDLLPRRLLIERPGLRLKLVVDAWRLEGSAP